MAVRSAYRLTSKTTPFGVSNYIKNKKYTILHAQEIIIYSCKRQFCCSQLILFSLINDGMSKIGASERTI